MKKINYLIGVAAILLQSCANDDLVRPVNPDPSGDGAPMSFAAYRGNQSRAQLEDDGITQFGVWAIKASGDDNLKGLALKLGANDMSDNVVMNNYVVRHITSSVLGSDWSYVTDDWSGLNPAVTEPVQYLKYWDGSFTNTYFFAYGPWTSTGITFDNGYDADNPTNPSITFPPITNGTSIATNYVYADAVKAINNDYITKGTTVAPNKVALNFHRILSTVEIKIYEDIPGYTVEMEALDLAAGNGAGAEAITGQGIVAIPATCTTTGTPVWSRGTLINKAVVKVSYTNTSFDTPSLSLTLDATNPTSNANLNFALPTGQIVDGNNITYQVGEATASDTKYYVVPISTGNTNAGLQFVMNYKLKAKDTNEVIHVKGARVYVPAAYTQWASNTKYTYVFKITKNSSGTTVGTATVKNDPEEPQPALYPIIFQDVTITDWSTNKSEWFLNSLLLNKTTLELEKDATETLTATGPEGVTTVSWTSSDTTVATVNNGEVTAVAAGTAVIQASCTYKPVAGSDTEVTLTANCAVKVTDPATPNP